jgi:hypothetical protein
MDTSTHCCRLVLVVPLPNSSDLILWYIQLTGNVRSRLRTRHCAFRLSVHHRSCCRVRCVDDGRNKDQSFKKATDVASNLCGSQSRHDIKETRNPRLDKATSKRKDVYTNALDMPGSSGTSPSHQSWQLPLRQGFQDSSPACCA